METPYVDQFRRILATAHNRPLSKFNKRRHFLVSVLLEHLLLPAVFIVILAWNCFRHQLQTVSWIQGTEKNSH